MDRLAGFGTDGFGHMVSIRDGLFLRDAINLIDNPLAYESDGPCGELRLGRVETSGRLHQGDAPYRIQFRVLDTTFPVELAHDRPYKSEVVLDSNGFVTTFWFIFHLNRL